jgi:hypothetical protein
MLRSVVVSMALFSDLPAWFSDCFTQHYGAGEDWAAIGTACAGLGGQNAVLASTAASPATLPASQKPDWLVS